MRKFVITALAREQNEANVSIVIEADVYWQESVKTTCLVLSRAYPNRTMYVAEVVAQAKPTVEFDTALDEEVSEASTD